jgi:hypothetical protein
MKILAITLSVFSFLILPPTAAFSFSNSGDILSADDSTDAPEYDFSIEYGSTRLYRGIRSSSNPYVKPSFEYAGSGGFFAGLGAYIPLDSGHVDETDLSVGYEFKLSERTKASIELIHFFFRNNKLANSLIKNEVELYLRHDFGAALKSQLFIDLDFGSEARDYSVTFDNSHEFILMEADDSRMALKPAFSITAGSLNLVKKVKKDVVSTGFGLTNYDLSLSLEYQVGRFIIEPDAAYDFPINSVGKKFPALQKAINSDPVFYFTASITYVID